MVAMQDLVPVKGNILAESKRESGMASDPLAYKNVAKVIHCHEREVWTALYYRIIFAGEVIRPRQRQKGHYCTLVFLHISF